MTMIRVRLGERSYDILITSDDPAGLGPFARARAPGGRAFVVADENVAAQARAAAQSLAGAGFDTRVRVLPPGEGQKALAVASSLYDDLADMQADRRTVVAAVG